MTDGETTQQARHRNGQVHPETSSNLDEVVFHLLIADEDLAVRAYQSRITLCGAVVQPRWLPQSPFDEEIGTGSPRYCPECVSEALRWSAETVGAR